MIISFIIPVYNTEKYLPECLDSILNQDISRDEYEIICVNDGSTDGSLAVLRRYESSYPNVIVIDQANKGICGARNAGFAAAKGEYIWFFDSDDFIADNVLGEIVKAVHETICDMLTVGCYTFTERLSPDEIERKNNRTIRANLFGNDVYAILHLFKRSFLKENDLFYRYDELVCSEDTIFVYEAKRLHPDRAYAPEIIYYYRRNQSSISMKDFGSDRKRIRAHEKAASLAHRYYHEDRNADTANIWMSNLWSALHELSTYPGTEIGDELRRLKQQRQWPVRRPPECTLRRSYMTVRTDLVGKTFDQIYMHSHTRIGFVILVIWSRMLKIKKQIAE